MAVAHVDRHAAGALMAALKKKIALTQLETVAPDQVRARARRGEVARWRGGDGRGGEGGEWLPQLSGPVGQLPPPLTRYPRTYLRWRRLWVAPPLPDRVAAGLPSGKAARQEPRRGCGLPRRTTASARAHRSLSTARRSTRRSSGVARPRRQRAPPPWRPCARAADPRAHSPCGGRPLRRRRPARGGPAPRSRATARRHHPRHHRPRTPWVGITRTRHRRSRRCPQPPPPSPPLPPTAWVMPPISLPAPASPGKTRSARSTCPPRRVSARPTCRRRPPPRQAHALRTPRSTAARPAAARRQARSARHVGDRVARARSGPRRVRRRPAPVCTDPQHLPQHLPHASRTSPADPLQTPCTPPALPRCIPPLRSCAPAAPLRRPFSAGFSGLAPLEWLSADTPLPGWGAGGHQLLPRPGSAGSAGGHSNGSRASRLSRGSGDSAASSARTEHAALRSSTSVRSRCSISESASTSDSRGTKGAFAVYLLAQSERVRACQSAIAPCATPCVP